MKNKLFTLEKASFLTLALFFFSLTFKYFENLRKALPKSVESDHAFTLFIVFLIIGSLSAGLYVGFVIAEKNISKNIEKINEPAGEIIQPFQDQVKILR